MEENKPLSQRKPIDPNKFKIPNEKLKELFLRTHENVTFISQLKNIPTEKEIRNPYSKGILNNFKEVFFPFHLPKQKK
ncbi:hypothetical protein M0811_07104 [Anaeramoeba ignava]|uniref:Uncharacterized protein n=1 Tax=Anaeramoeba ignava TaxID=1746090 RepID=A0A9Q0RCW6_ANAIG|nr:hypothetical protein M0811_07104 [Anaeramoeba ignava]